MSMPVSVGCQHLDVEACVGLCACAKCVRCARCVRWVRWVVVMMGGVTVADGVRVL